jgi:hypothetical protein
MLVYVAPISGGFMANQIELIAQLCDIGVVPDICMSTSGGNMAVYIAFLCNWKREKIMKHVGIMDDTMVVKQWVQGPLRFLPAPIWGFLKGSLYDRGTGDPFGGADNETTDLSSGTEVWSGAYNKVQHRSAYFTNKRCGETKMTKTSAHTHCMPLRFVNGDYEKLRDICYASAAVPGVQREVVIDAESHIDGGTSFASPFIAFQDNLREIANVEPVHIVYLHSSNFEKPSMQQKRDGMMSDTLYAVSLLTDGHVMSDISAVLTFLRTVDSFQGGKSLKYREFTGSAQALKDALRFLSAFPVTVLELLPLVNRSIDYCNFSSDEMLSVMFCCGENFKVRMHWFE